MFYFPLGNFVSHITSDAQFLMQIRPSFIANEILKCFWIQDEFSDMNLKLHFEITLSSLLYCNCSFHNNCAELI